MREICSYGSARGVPGNRHSYRNYVKLLRGRPSSGKRGPFPSPICPAVVLGACAGGGRGQGLAADLGAREGQAGASQGHDAMGQEAGSTS
jgi:hypothetical protein